MYTKFLRTILDPSNFSFSPLVPTAFSSQVITFTYFNFTSSIRWIVFEMLNLPGEFLLPCLLVDVFLPGSFVVYIIQQVNISRFYLAVFKRVHYSPNFDCVECFVENQAQIYVILLGFLYYVTYYLQMVYCGVVLSISCLFRRLEYLWQSIIGRYIFLLEPYVLDTLHANWQLIMCVYSPIL